MRTNFLNVVHNSLQLDLLRSYNSRASRSNRFLVICKTIIDRHTDKISLGLSTNLVSESVKFVIFSKDAFSTSWWTFSVQLYDISITVPTWLFMNRMCLHFSEHSGWVCVLLRTMSCIVAGFAETVDWFCIELDSFWKTFCEGSNLSGLQDCDNDNLYCCAIVFVMLLAMSRILPTFIIVTQCPLDGL